MAKEARLYVFNLHWNMTREELWHEFGRIGKVVDVFMPKDLKRHGRNKGFAFVEMNTLEEAADVHEHFDGTELRGRVCRVAPATERKPLAPRS